jgi:hypothetical protein
MNTQTNKSEQHAGNGDTASHSKKANESVARKFYVDVQGMSLEKAKAIVKGLVEKGILKDAEFYNKAIVQDAKEKERVAKRDAERKEQAERDAQARADFEAKREVEQNGDYKLDPLVEAQIKDFIEKGATKVVIVGMLKFMTKLNKVQIAKVIADLMPEHVKTHKITFNSLLDERLIGGAMTVEELDEFIKEFGNENSIKNRAYHLGRVRFANSLHSKYNK